MAELTDLTPLQNHDLVLGGIVTGVREGYTKTGKPYGIAKVEDYSGTAEFAFFGNEWVEKKNFSWKVCSFHERKVPAQAVETGGVGSENQQYRTAS